MPTGGHFFVGEEFSQEAAIQSAGVSHWEEGVGWGWLSGAVVPQFTCYSNLQGCIIGYFDPHNNDITNLWFGGLEGSTSAPGHPVWHWDGAAITKLQIPLAVGLNAGGPVFVSRVPGTNEVYASGNAALTTASALYKYDGVSTWSTIRGNLAVEGFIPLAQNSSTCVWMSWEPYDSKAGYWLDVNTQYTGADLPITSFRGFSQLADGSIFILTSGGDVYRSASINGPFALDNATFGSFPGNFGNSFYGPYMNSSADGTTIIVQGFNTAKVWVRNGADDWSEYDTGLVSSIWGGMPAAVDRQTLLRANSDFNAARYSIDGGLTWRTPPTPIAQRSQYCGAIVGEVSNERRLITCQDTTGAGVSSVLRWKGDAPYSPWAYWNEYLADPSAITGAAFYYRIVGFEDRHVVMSGNRRFAGEKNIVHYDPDLDSWSSFSYFQEATTYVYGTAFEAGKIHAVTEWRYDAELQYSRWNGISYDNSSIAGSVGNYALSQAHKPIHIQADESGQEVWVSSHESSQLWRSIDSGVSWTNLYAAAAAVHTDADQVRDIILVSTTEVYVAFNSTGTGTRFSLWDGASWSQAAPDIALESGKRCIFVDRAGDLWFLESNATGPTETYKLVDGSWNLEDTFTWSNGSRDVTGMASMQDDFVLGISMATDNAIFQQGNGCLSTYSDQEILGWVDEEGWGYQNRNWTDISSFGPAPPVVVINSSAQIDSLFLVREDLVRLKFTVDLAVIDALTDPTNYSISAEQGGDVEITGVLQPDGLVTTIVHLQIRGLKLGQTYTIQVNDGNLKDRYGNPLSNLSVTWRMHRTKVDTTVAGLPEMYAVRERSNFNGIIEAIMISDEEIGGDF